MYGKEQSGERVSGLRDHLGFWLRLVSNHVSQGFARKLLASGVTTAEWVILRELYEEKEQTPSDLAERLGMTRGAISKLVDRLIAKKFVSCRTRSDDRRFQAVSLGEAGRNLVPVLAELADRNDREFFCSLSATERELLKATLEKLVNVHELQKLPTE